MASIGRSLGDFGSQVAGGRDIAQDYRAKQQQMAFDAARQKQQEMMAPLLLQELQKRVQQMSAPQFQGTAKTLGGGEAAIIRDPEKGTISTQDILPGIKMADVDARISKMISGAPTHQAKLLLQSIRERVNDPNGDPAAILKDAETAYSKYIEQGKPQKKEEIDIHKGIVQTYDEEGNANEPMPIFKNGKINPELLDRQRDIAQSQQFADQTKFERQEQLQKDRMDAYARTYAQMRGSVYQYSVLDKNTGDQVMVNANTINENPGRFMAGSLGQQLKNREGVFDEIKYTTSQFDGALSKMTDNDFKALPRAQLAMALKSRDPRSAMSEFMGSEVASSLTPAQIDYVTGLTSLQESAMSLRSIAGMGQGSDTLRNAITAMLPGPATPSIPYAKRQMDLFRGELEALHRPIPESIRQSMGNTPTQTQPQSSATPTAIGPNGHKIVVRNGKWVDAQTGAPVQ